MTKLQAVKKSFSYVKRNKAKILLLFVTLSYLVVCQSCMRLRMSNKETKNFFETNKIKFRDTIVIIEEHKIHYLQTGNPKSATLFFIHGSPGSWDAYKNYLKDSLLLSKFRMIAIDRPGFGYSNFGNAENLNTQAHIIEKLIKKIGNSEPFFLIGHSLGGPIVVQMAANKPGYYKHLIIISGAVDPDAEEPENWRAIIKTKPIRYLIPGALRPANDELWWLKTDLRQLKPNLKNITSKITIIHGTKDFLVPFSNVAFMKKEFINAKSVETIPIANGSHFIPWDHFDIIRNALYQLE